MESDSIFIKVHRFMGRLLPVIGILIGSAKIMGTDLEKHVFRGMGVSDDFRILFGVLQIVFGILIAFPRTQLAATVVSMGLLTVAASLMAINGMFGIMLVPLAGLSTLAFFLWVRGKSLKGKE